MNDHKTSSHAPSCFCTGPLILVLGAWLLVNLVQLLSLIQEGRSVSATTANAQQAMSRYKLVSDKLENVAKDLITLSRTNSEAKEIVTQFNIQMNSPGTTPATPAKK
jgi:hypothetical protein